MGKTEDRALNGADDPVILSAYKLLVNPILFDALVPEYLISV
jgi:hypothetical protein